MKFFAGVIVMLALFSGFAIAAEPVLVVNPDVNVTSMDEKTVRYIFLGKKTSWDGGGRIIPVALEGGAVHKEFLKTFVRKTPSQFSTHWKRMTFTGKAEEIRTFTSEAALAEFVANTPGAVGYVDGASSFPGVKKLSIQ